MDDRVRACVAQLALMSPLAPCATGVRARGASRGPPFVQDLRVDGSVAGVGGELPEHFWLRRALSARSQYGRCDVVVARLPELLAQFQYYGGRGIDCHRQ